MKQTIFVALALALLSVGSAGAQTPSAEEAAALRQDVLKLLELTGSAKLGKQMLDQMLDSFKAMTPGAPAAFWDEVHREFDPQTLIELVIPIYEKHLTHEDIKGMIAFYETPLGRKLIGVLPAIAQESMQAGQQWGLEVAKKVQEKLKAQQQESPKG